MRLGYHNASFDFRSEESVVDSVVSLAQRVEAGGFAFFSLMDHFWQLPFIGAREEPFFDCYTLLPAVAAVTDSIEVGPLVTSPHYRNPGLLARMVTTLDHVSGGRTVFGIGAGWFEEEYDAFGYEFPGPATRVHQLAETVELLRAMWTEDSPVSWAGDHYAVGDAILEPKPVQDPHPPVLVGGGGEQLTLRAVARHADRWNLPGASPASFEHKTGVLAEYCEEVGRSLGDVDLTVLVGAVVRDTTEAAHEAYERLRARSDAGVETDRDDYRGLVGTPAEVAGTLDRFADLGLDMAMVRAERNDPETIDRLVSEVAPTVT